MHARPSSKLEIPYACSHRLAWFPLEVEDMFFSLALLPTLQHQTVPLYFEVKYQLIKFYIRFSRICFPVLSQKGYRIDALFDWWTGTDIFFSLLMKNVFRHGFEKKRTDTFCTALVFFSILAHYITLPKEHQTRLLVSGASVYKSSTNDDINKTMYHQVISPQHKWRFIWVSPLRSQLFQHYIAQIQKIITFLYIR